MSALAPSSWPEAWHVIARAVRAAIAEGRPLNNRQDVMQAAGLGHGPSCKVGAVDGMIAAGALLSERQYRFSGVSRYRLADREEWTPWPAPKAEARAAQAEHRMVLGALRRAIASETSVSSFRNLVATAGVAPSRVRPVAIAMLRRSVLREVRRGIAPAFRFRIVDTDLASAWVPTADAPAVVARRREPAIPVKRQALPSLESIPKTKGVSEAEAARRAALRKIQVHTLRMQHAVPQSEDEMREAIEAHLRAKGVTQIRTGFAMSSAPMPVQGKASGDGMVGRAGGC